ncbi:MAG: Alanine--tRNA ligase [Methanomassiliicoccales archaeon PtaU1.Bin124]|nr:MAG: Alanine--tRNA ligase [Methanomassiliicoccales archaeon PtaU1.Bin124]
MSASVEKLYEKDPYLAKFTAKVTSINGDSIELDRTAFYPGGGGQEADVGEIGGFAVTEVRYKDGSIIHRVPGQRFIVGQEVECKIAWDRRMDLMRAHTGEHLLFSSLQRIVPDMELVKIAITPSKKSLIVKGQFNWTNVLDAEKMVNEVIWQKMTTEDLHVTKDDPLIAQARIKLERIPGDKVRLVKIGDFDLAACAGIHVRNTWEIEMLLVEKLTSAKPVGDFEIEFSVGRKALYRSLYLSTLAIETSDKMGAHPEDLLSALDNQVKEMERGRSSLRHYAKQSIAQMTGEERNGVTIYSGVFPGVDRKTLSDEATKKVQEGKRVCILAEDVERLTLIVASSKDSGIDAAAVLQKALAELGGKGGGNKSFATGGAPESGLGKKAVDVALNEIDNQLSRG